MANLNKDIPDLPANAGGASLDGSELFEIKKGTGLGSSQKLTLNNLASKIKDIIASFFATAAQGAKADSAVQSIVAGTNISVDNTDPHNPKITGSGGTVKTVNTVNPDGSGNVPIAAVNVPFTPPTGMTSTNVQAAVAEAYNHGGGGGGAAVFIGVRAYNDGTQSIPANSSTAVTFNTNIYDTSAIHSTTTNTSRFIVPANLGGRWRISFKVKFSTTGGIAFIRKNGGTDTNNIIGSTVTGATALANTVTANLVAGDYIELFAYNPSAVTIGNTYATDQGSVTALEMQYVEGGGAGGASSGTYANAPTNPAYVGQVYQCTDCPLTMIGTSTGWNYFHRGENIVLPNALTTWVNQGTATLTNVGPYKVINAPPVAGDNQRILVKPLANLSNYTVTAKLAFLAGANQYAQGGLILRNSVSGLSINISFAGQTASGVTVNQQIQISKYNSPTSFSANYFANPYANPGVFWMRVVDDGTNRKIYLSFDGLAWLLLYSAARTDFVTPDQVGIYVSSVSATYSAAITCLSFQETTP